MSIQVDVRQTTSVRVTLSDDEAREVMRKYIQNLILGDENAYITKDGLLETWTNDPHGSGTTTTHGPATDLQKTAYKFLVELKRPADPAGQFPRC